MALTELAAVMPIAGPTVLHTACTTTPGYGFAESYRSSKGEKQPPTAEFELPFIKKIIYANTTLYTA